MSALSEKIKELGKAKGMTQTELAKELGIKTGTVSNYETGKSVPSEANVKKLSEVLGEELVADEKKPEEAKAEKKAAPKKKKETGKAPATGKKEEPKETPAAEKKEEPKAALVEEVKEPVREEKKEEVEEVAEKVRKGRKAAETLKKAAKVIAPVIAVQSLMGGTIVTEEVIKKVKAVAPDVEQIYVKPEENKAYWVSKKSAGSVNLWD